MKACILSLLITALVAGVSSAEDRTDNLIFTNGNDDSNLQSEDFLRINKDGYRNNDNNRNMNGYRGNGESYRNIDTTRNTDTFRHTESLRTVDTQRRQPSQMSNYNGKAMPMAAASNGNGVAKDFQGHGYYTKPINGQPEVVMARGVKSWNAMTNGRSSNAALFTNGNGQYRAMTSNGMVMTSNGLLSNGFVSNGLVSNGLVGNGLISNGVMTPNGLMASNGVAMTSSGLAMAPNGNGQYVSIMMPVGRSIYDGINLVAADYRSPQQYSPEQVVPAPAYASYGSYGTTNGYLLPPQPIGVTYGGLVPSYSTGYVGYGGTSANPAPLESAYSSPLTYSATYGSPVPAVSYNAPVPVTAYGAPVPVTYGAPVQIYAAENPAQASDYSDAYAAYATDYQTAYPASGSSDTNGNGNGNGNGEDYTVYSSALQVTNGENGNGDASSASTTSGTEGRSMFFNGKSNGNGNRLNTFSGKSVGNGNGNGHANVKISGNGNGNGNGLANGNGSGHANGNGSGHGIENANGNGKARFIQPIGDDFQHANNLKFTKSSEIQKMRENGGSQYY